MKKIVVGILLCISYAYAQDTITLHHERYNTTFDKKLHYPIIVHWTTTSNDVCKPHTPRRVERSNSYFKADPLLPDYTRLRNVYENNTGHYERGHNMDAADNSCNLQQMKDCHYFSSITPQTRELNQNTWGDLEDHTRRMVELYGRVEVWCGSFGHKDQIGPVSVPDSCWKIIRYNHTIEAYIFPNTHDVDRNHYDFYQTRVIDVRRATHLLLPDI